MIYRLKNILEIPDDSYADMAAEKLITELDKVVTDCQQSVKRAVMAAVLSMLPVFFNNTEEIQDYINSSLIQCSDEAEKKAVVNENRMIIATINVLSSLVLLGNEEYCEVV